MKDRTPKAEWAISKVETYVPAIKERVLLKAIAGHARTDGQGCFCKVETLAHEIGRSVRTTQRWIKTLVELGLLTVDYPERWERRSSRYQVTCCAFTLEELELITGVTGKQLILPLDVKQARSDVTVSDLWTVLGIRTTDLSTPTVPEADGCQDVTRTGDTLSLMGDSLTPYHELTNQVKHSLGATHIENGEALYRRKESDAYWKAVEEDRRKANATIRNRDHSVQPEQGNDRVPSIDGGGPSELVGSLDEGS